MSSTKYQQMAKQHVEESQLLVSISPVTHPNRHLTSNQKDKQQFAAYKNFVRNIQIQQKHPLQNQDSVILEGIRKNQSEYKNVKPSTKDKGSDEFKFTDFIAKKISPRNKVKTASWSNLRSTKNQQFKISHVPTATKITAQSQKRKNSPQELKGRPYVEKKPKKQLVLKQQKQASLTSQPKMLNQIKLRVHKLPELKHETSHSKKKEVENTKIEDFKDFEAMIKKKKVQKLKNDLSFSPILKTYDPRYFGLESKSTNFQKMGKQLLSEIKTKYWCYDNIENQEVYENFELLLCSDLKNK